MPSQSLVAPDAASLGFELAHAILDSNRLFRLRLSSQNLGQFPLAWCLANPIVTSVIIGPRTWDQDADNLGALEVVWPPADERALDALVPPGENTGKGFPDSADPVLGHPVVD